MRLKDIVSKDPGVHSGDLVFAGTRVPVTTLLDYLKGGHSVDRFLKGFPTVSRRQVEAFLERGLDEVETAVEAQNEVQEKAPAHARSH